MTTLGLDRSSKSSPVANDVTVAPVPAAPVVAAPTVAAPTFQGAHFTNLAAVNLQNGAAIEMNQLAIILQRQAATSLPTAGIPDPAVELQPRWQAMARELLGALGRENPSGTPYYLNTSNPTRYAELITAVIQNPEYWRDGENPAAFLAAITPLLRERIEAQCIVTVSERAVAMGEEIGRSRALGASPEDIVRRRGALAALLNDHSALFSRPEYQPFLAELNRQTHAVELRAFNEQLQSETLHVHHSAQRTVLAMLALPPEDPRRAAQMSAFLDGLRGRALFSGPTGAERLTVLQGQMNRWLTLTPGQLQLEIDICQQVQSFAADQVANLALGDMRAHRQRREQFEAFMSRPEVRDYLDLTRNPGNQAFLDEVVQLERTAEADARSRYGTYENPGRALLELRALMGALECDDIDGPTIMTLLRNADEAQRNTLLRLAGRELRNRGRLGDPQRELTDAEAIDAAKDYLRALPLTTQQRERMNFLLSGQVSQYDNAILADGLTRHAAFRTRQTTLDAQLASGEITAAHHAEALERLTLERVASRDDFILTVGTMIRGGMPRREFDLLVANFGNANGGLEARINDVFGASTWQALNAIANGNQPLADAIRFQSMVSESGYRLSGQQLVELLHNQGRDSVVAMCAAMDGGRPLIAAISASHERIAEPLRTLITSMLRGERYDALEVLSFNSLGLYGAGGPGAITIRVDEFLQTRTAIIGQAQAPVHERLYRRMAVAGFTGTIQEYLADPANAAVKTAYERELLEVTRASLVQQRARINAHLRVGGVPALTDEERRALPPGTVDDELTRFLLRRGSDGVARAGNGINWPEGEAAQQRARGVGAVCFASLVFGADSASLQAHQLRPLLENLTAREGMIASALEQRARFDGPNGYLARTQQNIDRWNRDRARAEQERHEMCDYNITWNPLDWNVRQAFATTLCGNDAARMFEQNALVASNQAARYQEHLTMLTNARDQFDRQRDAAIAALRAQTDIAMIRGGNGDQLVAAQRGMEALSGFLMRRHEGQIVGRLSESIDMSGYHADMDRAGALAAVTYNSAVALEGRLRDAQKVCILAVAVFTGPLGGLITGGLLSATCHSLEGVVAVYGNGADSSRVWADARGRFLADGRDLVIGAATGGLGRAAGAWAGVRLGAQAAVAGERATRLGRAVSYIGRVEQGVQSLSYTRHLVVHATSTLVSSNSYFAVNQAIQYHEVRHRFEREFGTQAGSGLSTEQYEARRAEYLRQNGITLSNALRGLVTTNALGLLGSGFSTSASRATAQFQNAQRVGDAVEQARRAAMFSNRLSAGSSLVLHATVPVAINATFEGINGTQRYAETAEGHRIGTDSEHNVIVVDRSQRIVAVWNAAGQNLLERPDMRTRYARLGADGAILDANGRPIYAADGATLVRGQLFVEQNGNPALIRMPSETDTSPAADAQRRAYARARDLTALERVTHSFQEDVLKNPHVLLSFGQSLGGFRTLRAGDKSISQQRSENSYILRAGRATGITNFITTSRPVAALGRGRDWLLGPTGSAAPVATPLAGTTTDGTARRPQLDLTNALAFNGSPGLGRGVVSDSPSSPLGDAMAAAQRPRPASDSSRAEPARPASAPVTPARGASAATPRTPSPLASSAAHVALPPPPPVARTPVSAGAAIPPPVHPAGNPPMPTPAPAVRPQVAHETQQTVASVRLLDRQARALVESHRELERQQVREQDVQRRETIRQRRAETAEQIPGVLRQVEQQSGVLVRLRQEQAATARSIVAQNPADPQLQRSLHLAERRVLVAELRQLRAGHALARMEHEQRADQIRSRPGSERALERHEVAGYRARANEQRQEMAQLARWERHEVGGNAPRHVARIERMRAHAHVEHQVTLASARVHSAERHLAAHDRVAARNGTGSTPEMRERRSALEERVVGAQLVRHERAVDRSFQLSGGNLSDPRARAVFASREGLVLERSERAAALALIRAERADLLAGGVEGYSTALARVRHARAEVRLQEREAVRVPSPDATQRLELSRLRLSMCSAQLQHSQELHTNPSATHARSVERAVRIATAQRDVHTTTAEYLSARRAAVERARAFGRADGNSLSVARAQSEIRGLDTQQRLNQQTARLTELTFTRAAAEQKYAAASRLAAGTADVVTVRQRQQLETAARHEFRAARQTELEAQLCHARQLVTRPTSPVDRAVRLAQVRALEAAHAHLVADARLESLYLRRAEARSAVALAADRAQPRGAQSLRLLAIERELAHQCALSNGALARKVGLAIGAPIASARRGEPSESVARLSLHQQSEARRLRDLHHTVMTEQSAHARALRAEVRGLEAALALRSDGRAQRISEIHRLECAIVAAERCSRLAHRELLRGNPLMREAMVENSYRLRMLGVERLEANVRHCQRIAELRRNEGASPEQQLRNERRVLAAQERALLAEGAILLRSRAGLGAAGTPSFAVRAQQTRECLTRLQALAKAQEAHEQATLRLRTAPLQMQLATLSAELKAGKGTLGKAEKQILSLQIAAVRDQIAAARLPLVVERLARLQMCAERCAELRRLLPAAETAAQAAQMQKLLDSAVTAFRRGYSAVGTAQLPLEQLSRRPELLGVRGDAAVAIRQELAAMQAAQRKLVEAGAQLAAAQQRYNQSWGIPLVSARRAGLREATAARHAAEIVYCRAENVLLVRRIELARQWGIDQRVIRAQLDLSAANSARLVAEPRSRVQRADVARAEIQRLREFVAEHAKSTDAQVVAQRTAMTAAIQRAERALEARGWAAELFRSGRVNRSLAEAARAEGTLRESMVSGLRARAAELSRTVPGEAPSAAALRAAQLKAIEQQIARYESSKVTTETKAAPESSVWSRTEPYRRWGGRVVYAGMFGMMAYQIYQLQETIRNSGVMPGTGHQPLPQPTSLQESIHAILNNLEISTEMRDSQLMELLQTHFVMASHEELLQMRDTIYREYRTGSGIHFVNYMSELGRHEAARRIRLQRITNSQRRLHGLSETPLVDTWRNSIVAGEAGGF